MYQLLRNTGIVLTCLLLLALTGCQRFNLEKTYNLQANETKVLRVDAPSGNQKVSVTITSTKPVSAALWTEGESKDNVQRVIQSGEGPIKVEERLGGQNHSTDIHFDATVPAKKPYILVIDAQEATEVKIKIQGI